jgi:putative endonuclease
MAKKQLDWWIYILCCSDGTLYTGITTNLERRVVEHNDSNKGAKYTRSRRPVQLVYSELQTNRSQASKREYALKKMCRIEKLNLIKREKRNL